MLESALTGYVLVGLIAIVGFAVLAIVLIMFFSLVDRTFATVVLLAIGGLILLFR